ncbi:MAG: hypothetical protein J6S71_02705 [Clostridia bacterium]|nr:hypothetical protein [Clostridia bacterium]
MSEFNISIESGTSKRLPVGNKWSEKDIIVTATGGTEDLNADLTEQEALIEELKAVLRGKAAGGGVNPEETSIFDPTKETILTRSTASYKDIFLTKTMIAYVNTGKYAGYLGCKFDAVVGDTYEISWDKISSSQENVFYYESDTILTKVDDHYGTRLYPEDNPFTLTATKPYVYIWLGHPSAPSTAELVLVTGLMVHKKAEA